MERHPISFFGLKQKKKQCPFYDRNRVGNCIPGCPEIHDKTNFSNIDIPWCAAIAHCCKTSNCQSQQIDPEKLETKNVEEAKEKNNLN